jgi:hypothetical protein
MICTPTPPRPTVREQTAARWLRTYGPEPTEVGTVVEWQQWYHRWHASLTVDGWLLHGVYGPQRITWAGLCRWWDRMPMQPRRVRVIAPCGAPAPTGPVQVAPYPPRRAVPRYPWHGVETLHSDRIGDADQ